MTVNACLVIIYVRLTHIFEDRYEYFAYSVNEIHKNDAPVGPPIRQAPIHTRVAHLLYVSVEIILLRHDATVGSRDGATLPQ